MDRKTAVRGGALALIALGLPACGGGGGGNDPADPFGGRATCASIGGTITEFRDPACTGCRIENAG